jgi:hypothetical protein
MAFLLIIPVVNQILLRRMKGTLGQLRGVFVSFGSTLIGVGVVVLILYSSRDTTVDSSTLSGTVAAVVVAALGFSAVVASWQVKAQLPGDDLGQLLVAYRTRFFLRIAFAESGALLGYVGFFLTENPLVYLVGLLPAVLGFAMSAPTRANLEREDQAMAARGCRFTIYRALLIP